MLTLAAAAAFLLGAIFQAVNGPDLNAAGAWPFWLLVGLCALGGPGRGWRGAELAHHPPPPL